MVENNLDYDGALEELEEYIEDNARSVEDYLNDVDYEFKGYVPTHEALMFVNFIKEVNDGKKHQYEFNIC